MKGMTVTEALQKYVDLAQKQQNQTELLLRRVMDTLDDVAEEFCESYCHYAAIAKDRDELFKQCEKCPLGRL